MRSDVSAPSIAPGPLLRLTIAAAAVATAVVISIEAGIRCSMRFAVLARMKAAAETNEKRKKELELIAQSCSWVPEHHA